MPVKVGSRRKLLVVVSGTIGDVLPIARVVDELKDRLIVDVLTNSEYARYFESAREVHTLTYHPSDIASSRAGQRLLEGGYFGLRRLAGLYGVVHPNISENVEVCRRLLPLYENALVVGVPFGISLLAESCKTKVIRLYYQPHWPNSEIKALYINAIGQWGPQINLLSHSAVDLVARLLFKRKLLESLNAGAPSPQSWRRWSSDGHIINESYWRGHETLFAVSKSFTHRTIEQSSNAHVTGFIRPRALQAGMRSAELGMHLPRPIIFCGFGSMQTIKTAKIVAAVARAAQQLGGSVLTQSLGRSSLINYPNVRNLHFVDHRSVFPECDALIHHGGAGTTLASLDSGRPFCVMPQWADQFYWAHRTRELALSDPPAGDTFFDVDMWRATIGLLLKRSDSSLRERQALAAGEDGAREAAARILGFCES